MTKREWLQKLQKCLSGLPKEDVAERISFYGEMIDDRTEEGTTEEEAVAQIGDADEIASQIISEYPFSKLVKERIGPKRQLNAVVIVLLVLGAPLWLLLLLTAASIVLTLLILLVCIAVVIWSLFAAFAVSAAAGICGGVGYAFSRSVWSGLTWVGLGFICLGISIFLFFGCRKAFSAIVHFLKTNVSFALKKCFMKEKNK